MNTHFRFTVRFPISSRLQPNMIVLLLLAGAIIALALRAGAAGTGAPVTTSARQSSMQQSASVSVPQAPLYGAALQGEPPTVTPTDVPTDTPLPFEPDATYTPTAIPIYLSSMEPTLFFYNNANNCYFSVTTATPTAFTKQFEALSFNPQPEAQVNCTVVPAVNPRTTPLTNAVPGTGGNPCVTQRAEALVGAPCCAQPYHPWLTSIAPSLARCT